MQFEKGGGGVLNTEKGSIPVSNAYLSARYHLFFQLLGEVCEFYLHCGGGICMQLHSSIGFWTEDTVSLAVAAIYMEIAWLGKRLVPHWERL